MTRKLSGRRMDHCESKRASAKLGYISARDRTRRALSAPLAALQLGRASGCDAAVSEATLTTASLPSEARHRRAAATPSAPNAL